MHNISVFLRSFFIHTMMVALGLYVGFTSKGHEVLFLTLLYVNKATGSTCQQLQVKPPLHSQLLCVPVVA